MSFEAILLVPGFDSSGYVLDSVSTGLESAWSVGRRLLNSYSGPVIRVRRSSDNAESDFSGNGPNGAVSAADVAAFCGAGNGFLRTIYDQSGNGRNLVQAISANQPVVVSSGAAQTQNGKLWALFSSASSTVMEVAASTALYNFFHNGTSSTIYFVANPSNTAGNSRFMGNIAGTLQRGMRVTFTNAEAISHTIVDNNVFAVNVTKTGVAALNVHTLFFDADNATAANRESTWRDGSLLTTDNTSSGSIGAGNATNSFALGSAGANNYDGYCGELVVWSQDKTANRSVWEDSAQTFWGTP